MRFYSFVNGLYMNSLQYGLQTAHAVSEMSLQPIKPMYNEWAKNHKTIIILDAVNLAGLHRVFSAVANLCNRYNALITNPNNYISFSSFNEDEQSLGGIMTCVSVILPERIYGREEIKPAYEEIKLGNKIHRYPYKTPRERFEQWFENANTMESFRYNVPLIEDLLYCLVKTHNLAPR